MGLALWLKIAAPGTELTAEETPSWQHVVKLVAGAGGAKKFTRISREMWEKTMGKP